jgi:hypothetical protein
MVTQERAKNFAIRSDRIKVSLYYLHALREVLLQLEIWLDIVIASEYYPLLKIVY